MKPFTSSVILSAAKDPALFRSFIRPRKNLPRMKNLPWCLIPMLLLLGSFASAQTLTGTVKNSTTGKPCAGDEVILSVSARAWKKPDAPSPTPRAIHFQARRRARPAPVRVIHQEVTYHRMAPPGTTSVEVEVYDVGKKIEGIEVVADIMRFQAAAGTDAGRAYVRRSEYLQASAHADERTQPRVLCSRRREGDRRPGHDRRRTARELRSRSRRREREE